jgi:hypothetical protein
MLRFCMKAAGFFLAGEHAKGADFVEASHPRLARAMEFSRERLRGQYRREREGWNQFYDLLDEVARNAPLRAKAIEIIESCRVQA